MDIKVYDELYQGLSEFLTENASSCYKPSLVHYPQSKPTYPSVIFEEIRNVNGAKSFGDIPDKTSDLGYRVKIYAKTSGNVTKMTIARTIGKYVDNFLTVVGLRQVSYNPDPLVADGDLYGLIITYSANFYDNRRKII